MKGGIGWNLRSWLRDSSIWCSCLEKLIQNCGVKTITKHIYVRFCIRFVVYNKQIMFSKDAANLKTTISQRSLRNSSLLLLLFEFNNFSFLIDIIDNIIYASGTCHQNSNHWRCSIIAMCLRLYHVTSILHWHWKVFWSCDMDVYTFKCNFDRNTR